VVIFEPLALDGAYSIGVERLADERGFFARTWCAREFAEHGLSDRMVQGSIAYNEKPHTLRGLHYHAAGFPQARLVRVLEGAAFFVVLDLRPESATFLQHVTTELSRENLRALYVPPGLALGYQTLVADSMIYYLMPEFYDPAHERGVRWDDPAFGIDWPEAERTLKDRDANYPDFHRSDLD
jgi:dTDP-4-dehydrorhamnose 3,5-epimerase